MVAKSLSEDFIQYLAISFLSINKLYHGIIYAPISKNKIDFWNLETEPLWLNPVGKTKSVAFSESGLRESQRLLAELFAAADEKG
jgi:hypothetical protein